MDKWKKWWYMDWQSTYEHRILYSAPSRSSSHNASFHRSKHGHDHSLSVYTAHHSFLLYSFFSLCLLAHIHDTRSFCFLSSIVVVVIVVVALDSFARRIIFIPLVNQPPITVLSKGVIDPWIRERGRGEEKCCIYKYIYHGKLYTQEQDR